MLVTLLSGQRCQTVHALTFSGMTITSDTVHFEIAKLLKTSIIINNNNNNNNNKNFITVSKSLAYIQRALIGDT